MKNGKQLLGKDLIFISQISRDGQSIVNIEGEDMEEEWTTKFTLQSLSVSHKTYIASEVNSYVVKIKPTALIENTPKYKLWKHINDEHDLTLLDTDLGEIIRLANECNNK